LISRRYSFPQLPANGQAPRQQRGVGVKELVINLLIWIGGNSPLAFDGGSLPEIAIVEQAEIFHVAFGEKSTPAMRARGMEISGLYDYEENRILLSDGLDLSTTKGKAVLVHELVHFLQYRAGDDRIAQCKNQLESLAYHVEAEYLEAHGDPFPFDHDHFLKIGRCPKG